MAQLRIFLSHFLDHTMLSLNARTSLLLRLIRIAIVHRGQIRSVILSSVEGENIAVLVTRLFGAVRGAVMIAV